MVIIESEGGYGRFGRWMWSKKGRVRSKRIGEEGG